MLGHGGEISHHSLFFIITYPEKFFFFSVFLPMNTSYSISNKQHSKGGFIGNFREDLIVLLKLKNGVFMLKDS